MALNFSLSLERYLNWETNLTYYVSFRDKSPIFTYMNMKWKLLSGVKDPQGCNAYYIVLINCDKMEGFTPFSVSTYLQRSGNYSELKGPTVTVNHGFEFLYFENRGTVYQKMNATSNDKNIKVTVKCVFFPSTDLFLDVKIEKEDKAIDNPDKDLSCQNNGNFPLEITDYSPSDRSSAKTEMASHFQSMSEDLGSMFDQDLMTDVTIKCGDVVVSAHKNILAARSKILADMLQNVKCENKCNLDNLRIKTSVLRPFLRYLYTGQIKDLSEDNVLDLYSTSYEYEVHALQEECSCFLAKNLNSENYLNILTLAGKYNDEWLKDAAALFISHNSSLLDTDNWINFSKLSSAIAIDVYQKFAKKVLSNNVQA